MQLIELISVLHTDDEVLKAKNNDKITSEKHRLYERIN